ncbi:MAG TPA: hypothetical protein PKW80_11525 [Bacteroidales bacterium]|nr:hypothetical protein [Bacteroidales bacterium]
MKKSIVLFACVILSYTAFAQKITKGQVPPAVMNMLFNKVNDTITPAWELTGEIYKASFTKDELIATVDIKQSGEWVKTVWTMPYKYVPQSIKDNVLANYEGYKVFKSSIQYRTDGDYYVVELKKKKESKSLLYNLKGEFVKIDTDLVTPVSVPKP